MTIRKIIVLTFSRAMSSENSLEL